jgi:hypothetical protein
MGQCGSELHATTGDLRPAIAFDNADLDSEFTFLSATLSKRKFAPKFLKYAPKWHEQN